MGKYKYQSLTHTIIKGYYEVYNELGTGFLESVYENALTMALKDLGLDVDSQYPIDVYFKGRKVGNYKADLIVEERVLVEIKAANSLLSVHKAQLINYLKATDIEVGLLLNFGDEPEFKRYIFNKK